MKTRPEYRAQARAILNGQWKNTVILGAIYLVALLLVETPALFTMESTMTTQTSVSCFSVLYSFLVLIPVTYAICCAFLSFVRGEITSEELCHETKTNFASSWSRIVPTYLLMTIVILGLSIVTFGIAGIIFSYAYKMIPYLLKDYPELNPKEVLRASREMMKGHKWDLFMLELSFIGWEVLCILTAGIGFIFLIPYQSTTFAYYYNDLKAETVTEQA